MLRLSTTSGAWKPDTIIYLIRTQILEARLNPAFGGPFYLYIHTEP